MQKLKILTKPSDVLVFVKDVVVAADANKKALGFFAESVFYEYARQGGLYVATRDVGSREVYAGHLLFDCRYPKAKVIQIFATPESRKLGVAFQLLNRLKQDLTKDGFMSIQARVAEDLQDANEFWGRQDFYVQSVVAGGKTTNRKILVRTHELKSPQLFELSGVNSSNPLGLEHFAGTEKPIYLIDLNVLYDLNPKRLRNDLAVGLFQAERMGVCGLAISSEIKAELKRTALAGSKDPMLFWADIFPTFPLVDDKPEEALLKELSRLVFPNKVFAQINVNEKSDLCHLATAIQHQLTGLITNDQAIVDAGGEVKRLYGVQVCSPTVFRQVASEVLEDDSFALSSSEVLELRKLGDQDALEAKNLLQKLGLSASEISSHWGVMNLQSKVATTYGVWNDHAMNGYLVFQSLPHEKALSARIAVDESKGAGEQVAQGLLGKLLSYAASADLRKVKLQTASRQEIVRTLAVKLGFVWSPGEAAFHKLALGMIVTPEGWKETRDDLHLSSGVKLPTNAPLYNSINQQVEVITPTGNRSFITLQALESLLSPSLFCLRGRPAVITPVARQYAEHLLGHLPQQSLLPRVEATLHREKHYLSSPKTLRLFKKGALIFFYESQRNRGSGSVIAVARVKHAYFKTMNDLSADDLKPSVLNEVTVEAIGRSPVKTVTVFDNLLLLEKAVPLSTLKRIGCGRSTDLLTTRSISDDQVAAILAEGFYSG